MTVVMVTMVVMMTVVIVTRVVMMTVVIVLILLLMMMSVNLQNTRHPFGSQAHRVRVTVVTKTPQRKKEIKRDD